MRKSPLFLATLALSVTGCDGSSPEGSLPFATREAAIKESLVTKFRLSADPVPGEYIVVLKPEESISPQSADELAKAHRGRAGRVFLHALKGFVAHMSEEDARELAADARVKYVEENGRVQATSVEMGATWGLDRINQVNLPLDQTYSFNTAGAGVHAYVIDTGIRSTHSEFIGRVTHDFTSITDGNGAEDCSGHGTHVAGTLGGSTYGVAKAVSLHAVRVLDCNGFGPIDGVIAGVDWVTAHHQSPAVANMSLGGVTSQALDDAVANSIASGVVYAIAAGNDAGDACLKSPARTPNAITVGATESNDARASYSNFGTCVDIFAPGTAITSSWNTDDGATKTISGTSMATPHVAGAAALYLGTNPTASPAEVASMLTNLASAGKVSNPGTGSPNLLLYTATLGDGSGDNTVPTAALTAPSSGATVAGTVTLTADASDNVGVTRVFFFVNGAFVGMDDTAPYSAVWDTTQVGNGVSTVMARAYDASGNVGSSAAVPVTVNNLGVAAYDATLQAPRCAIPGTYCDTGTLVKGRGNLGPEQGAPNTLSSSCADGTTGTYMADESLERIRISTVDGSQLAAGKTVRVEVTVFAFGDGSADSLDLFSTGDANNPSWTLLATLRPTVSGLQVLSTTYSLPAGTVQAVRGNFRYTGSVGSCSTGGFDDRDDLVFAVAGGQLPPSASFISSCSGLSCSFTDTSTDPDGTIATRSWSFGDGGTSTAQNPSHTYAAPGSFSVSLTVTDSQGLSSTRTQTVTATVPGAISLSAIKRTVAKKRFVDLTWSGASGTNVDVFRNGTKAVTTANDGAYSDQVIAAGSYTYQICNAGTGTCSNNVTVTF